MTMSGWRSSFTVTYPSGACANVPIATATASQTAQRDRPRTNHAAAAVASVRPSGIVATMRFPNSTNAW